MSAMEREIREQPDVIRRLLDDAAETVDRLAAALAGVEVGWALLAARGSSDNAARYAQYLLGWRNRLPAALATPSLLTVYGVEPRLDGALAVGISQSGQSPDVVSVLESARRQGRPAVAMTNDPDSPLAAAATVVVPLRAGTEQAVAATKTYTASLVATALLSAALEEPPARTRTLTTLGEVPDAVADAVDRALDERAIFDRYASMDRCVVVGRGLNYGTAFEIALKVKELTAVAAEPHSPADLLHGPIAAVEPESPAVLVAPNEPSRDSIAEIVPHLVERGADLVIVAESDDLLGRGTTGVRLIPAPAPWLTPVTAVIPGQVMAHRLARVRGLDPDDPAGLSKVTRTR